MNIDVFFVWLPLADISDLIGVLVFVIFAIISVLSKRSGSPAEEKESTRKTAPFRQPPSPTPSAPSPAPDLGEEMRRLLEQIQRAGQPPHRPQSPTATPRQIPPRLQPQPSSQKLRETRFRKKLGPSMKPRPVVSPVEQTIAQPLLAQEVASTMEIVHKEVEAAAAQIAIEPVEPPSAFALTTVPEQTVFKLDRALLASPDGLRQAIVVAEILGKPRALSAWSSVSASMP